MWTAMEADYDAVMGRSDGMVVVEVLEVMVAVVKTSGSTEGTVKTHTRPDRVFMVVIPRDDGDNAIMDTE